MGQATLFEKAGGEAALRPLVATFVARMVSDLMIGFLFRRTDVTRLTELEYQFAAIALGAPLAYTGRPLRAAHKRFHIAGGQFARRREILRATQAEFGLAEPVQRAWLAHVDALRPEITGDPPGRCHRP